MAAYTLRVGADPEMFLKKGRSWVCADGIIQGTKEHPFAVPFGAVQVDGMAVEFNIKPAMSANGFVRNIKGVMKHLDALTGDNKIVAIPSVTFNKEVWENAPKDAKELGCSPDYNAWTGKENPKPKGPKAFRTAAGHVHIGWTEGADIKSPEHIAECEMVIKELDARLGIPSLLIDGDSRRRKLYGAAGAYRPKSYGVEYRVLSNFWLQNESYMRWVFNVVESTLESLYVGEAIQEQSVGWLDVQVALDTFNDKSRHEELDIEDFIERNHLEMPNDF